MARTKYVDLTPERRAQRGRIGGLVSTGADQAAIDAARREYDADWLRDAVHAAVDRKPAWTDEQILKIAVPLARILSRRSAAAWAALVAPMDGGAPG